ncbi:MAG: DUF1499 domain-containing protein [Spirochaetota bacterium]
MRAWSASYAILAVAALTLAGCAGAQTKGDFMDKRFAPCPESPNCVSSYAADEPHAVDALPMPSGDAMQALREVVASFPRTKIVVEDGDYLHATFTSLVFRFVDDVELRIDREAGVVHVRSASRVGYGDMGANRRRVESIRERLEERS